MSWSKILKLLGAAPGKQQLWFPLNGGPSCAYKPKGEPLSKDGSTVKKKKKVVNQL